MYTITETEDARKKLVDILLATPARNRNLNPATREWESAPVVYTTVNSVSQSGMSRRIRCYTITDNENYGESGFSIYDITWLVARAIGYSMNDKGLYVSGCGMDMGFHVVNSLSYALGDKLPGHAGYTIKQEWL